MRGDGFLSFPLFSRPGSRATLLATLLVVSASALIVAPLPSFLLDFLLAANLGFSLLVLLGAIVSRSGVRLASFPSIALIATLLRLGLAVAVCRLILVEGHAGTVVPAFGHFFARNNYIAGALLFLTLMVIQWVVVAKGSERSAEVAARFALDGLPGRQMAIDAELRGGTISNSEAQRQRERLTAESQFYGAMDGAMKLVKGDVAASLLIAIVSFGGGLAIGILDRDLVIADALKRYGLLTLGAGIITQLGALMVATAGGILVTRGASGTPEAHGSTEPAFGSTSALRAAALVALVLAVIPGLPALPFALVAAGFAGASWLRARHTAEQRASWDPWVVPWSLELHPEQASLLDGRAGLRENVDRLRENLFQELGLALPACTIALNPRLTAGSARLLVREIPAASIELPTDREATLSYVLERVEANLRARAADFIGLDEVQLALDRLEPVARATVQKVTAQIRLPLLTEILQRLVSEGVSIRDLKSILEALTQAPTHQKKPGELADFVRSRLARSLTYQLTRGTSALDVIVLDTVVEDTLRGALPSSADYTGFGLAPAVARDLIAATERAVNEAEATTGKARVVLAAPDIRRSLQRLLVTDFPSLRVISPTELVPDLALNPVATVNVRGI